MNWRKELSKRYKKITDFHAEVSAHFYKYVGDHREFESRRHRLFLDQVVNENLNIISALISIAVADARPVARFQNWILCEQLPKNRIRETLLKAFPGAVFQIELNEKAR